MPACCVVRPVVQLLIRKAGMTSLGLLPALQWQLGGWCALICTLQAIANMKTKDWDIKQVISAMT